MSSEHIYFIGVGGIGMSALAQYFHEKGSHVIGYDRKETAITQRLEKQGITVSYEVDTEHISSSIDLVVYTPAIPSDHKLLKYFRKKDIPVKKRARVMGEIVSNGFTIAIAGSHGKTTVAAMTAHLLQHQEVNCTAFIGGVCLNYDSNFVAGGDEVYVVEADEYDRSFLQLEPNIAVVTAIDSDHLEVYGNEEGLLRAFDKFLSQVPLKGQVLLQQKVKSKIIPPSSSLFTYQLGDAEESDFQASHISIERQNLPATYDFTFVNPQNSITDVKSPMPGKHNIENAVAALSVGYLMKLPLQDLKNRLAAFEGVQRRFEYRVCDPNIIYIDDYAHHPAEVSRVIDTVKELYPDRKLTAVFQPHLYSRTEALSAQFAQSLQEAEEIILLPIYPAREQPKLGVTTALIYQNCDPQKTWLFTKADALQYIDKDRIELLLTLGAGDIDELVKPIEQKLVA